MTIASEKDEVMSEVREIDVEAIMRRIRDKISQQNGPEGPTRRQRRGSPFDDGQGAVDFDCLRSGYDIQHVPLSSHRRIVGRLVVAVKKALRKLLMPFLGRQVAYNAANMRVATHLREWMEALDSQCALVSRQIDSLERSRVELEQLASRIQVELQEIESNFLAHARLELRQEMVAAQSQALREMGADLRAWILAAQSPALQAMRAELRAEVLAAQSQVLQEMRAELRARPPAQS